MNNQTVEDPRTLLDRYYYLDNGILNSIDSAEFVEIGTIYFTITSSPDSPSEVLFVFMKCIGTGQNIDFDLIINSTDWHYYPLFLKKNVIEKLKELVND